MPFSEKGIIDLDVAQKIIEDIRAKSSAFEYQQAETRSVRKEIVSSAMPRKNTTE